MHCSITLEDGTVAENTLDDEPIRFVMGDGTITQKLERALYGLKAGEEESLKIGPENAFGHHDPEAVMDRPRSDFPDDMNVQVGQIIEFTLPEGDEALGSVLEVYDDTVKMDFNHPIAGHEIQFYVQVIEVHPPKESEEV
jgi:FKBP-type peptidyl-prolyl cis-trans isomerase SlpA